MVTRWYRHLVPSAAPLRSAFPSSSLPPPSFFHSFFPPFLALEAFRAADRSAECFRGDTDARPGRVVHTWTFNFALFEAPPLLPRSRFYARFLAPFTAWHSATPALRFSVCVRSLPLSFSLARDIITIYQTRIIGSFHESSTSTTSTD